MRPKGSSPEKPAGASAALLNRALGRAFVLVPSVALEYEAVCRDPAQRIVSGHSESEVETLVTALCAVAELVETRFLWRPQLHDPADEMVLEAAIIGTADALVTFNRYDFGQAPARFGIMLRSPSEAQRRLPT